jgi:trimethylguanosine synthase
MEIYLPRLVISLDTNPTRLAFARHNATIYGVADRIEFVLADYPRWARSYIGALPLAAEKPKIDIFFLDPPWGGPKYDNTETALAAKTKAELSGTPYPEYSLASILPIHGAQLFNLSRRISRNIAYFLPRGTILEEISALVGNGDCKSSSGMSIISGPEVVEVEEQWMSGKLKAITCYFGGLVSGQEHLL